MLAACRLSSSARSAPTLCAGSARAAAQSAFRSPPTTPCLAQAAASVRTSLSVLSAVWMRSSHRQRGAPIRLPPNRCLVGSDCRQCMARSVSLHAAARHPMMVERSLVPSLVARGAMCPPQRHHMDANAQSHLGTCAMLSMRPHHRAIPRKCCWISSWLYGQRQSALRPIRSCIDLASRNPFCIHRLVPAHQLNTGERLQDATCGPALPRVLAPSGNSGGCGMQPTPFASSLPTPLYSLARSVQCCRILSSSPLCCNAPYLGDGGLVVKPRVELQVGVDACKEPSPPDDSQQVPHLPHVVVELVGARVQVRQQVRREDMDVHAFHLQGSCHTPRSA